ncbi:MAG: glutamate--tRNA ligase, partial [Planctomycetes bacterium]|nr:glutamate--tRNA ligase [Planctomycetota bacterium]
DAIRDFTLERVNKAPASFDPQKLLAFQTRWMNQLDTKKKVAMVLPYLQKAGWVSQPPPCDIANYLNQIVVAAGDRIKVAGDILQFDELFSDDNSFAIDQEAYAKKCKADPSVVEAVRDFCNVIHDSENLGQSEFEPVLKSFVEQRGIKLGNFMAGLRIALTGKTTGLTLFDYLTIFGKQRAIARIQRVLHQNVA